VSTILPQMRGDPVGTRCLAGGRCLDRIRLTSSTRLP